MTNRINMNDTLQPGQDRWSLNGKYQLFFQEDANLVLYQNVGNSRNPLWSTNTTSKTGSSGYKLQLQHDGNLVVSNAKGPVWSSNSFKYGAKAPYIVVQDDGNVALYDNSVAGCHWATNTEGR